MQIYPERYAIYKCTAHGPIALKLTCNSAIMINCMIKVLALIGVCCRTCSSEQLPLCKIHRGKLSYTWYSCTCVYILFIFFHTEQYKPLDKKKQQGNTIKNNYCLETETFAVGAQKNRLIETPFSTQNKCLIYDNNIRSECSKEPSQRDDSFEPPPPSPSPPHRKKKKKKKKKKKYIYIYIYIL